MGSNRVPLALSVRYFTVRQDGDTGSNSSWQHAFALGV